MKTLQAVHVSKVNSRTHRRQYLVQDQATCQLIKERDATCCEEQIIKKQLNLSIAVNPIVFMVPLFLVSFVYRDTVLK